MSACRSGKHSAAVVLMVEIDDDANLLVSQASFGCRRDEFRSAVSVVASCLLLRCLTGLVATRCALRVAVPCCV